MDLFIIAAAAATTISIALMVIVWRRRQRRELLGELAELPPRVFNPRQFAHLKRIRAWQLEVTQSARAYPWAREALGKRFRSEAAVPLPIAGYGKQCRCLYVPVTENRRGKRRMDPIDRPKLDFDAKSADRRHLPGHRKEDNWRGERQS